MKLKFEMIIKSNLRIVSHLLLKVAKKAFIRNSYYRLARKYAKMEAGLAAYRIFRAAGKELIRRPRVRLAAASILTLTLLMVFSAHASKTLKANEADIKINGKAVLVASKIPDNTIDDAQITATISPKLSPFDYKYPVESGQISQGFSSFHKAVDIATGLGSDINPIGSGIVEFAGAVSDGKGNIVIVDHGDGLKTIYAHMGKIEVGAGNMVNGNSVLGTVGLTGHTTGPHVHLEVYDLGVPINPQSVLPN